VPRFCSHLCYPSGRRTAPPGYARLCARTLSHRTSPASGRRTARRRPRLPRSAAARSRAATAARVRGAQPRPCPPCSPLFFGYLAGEIACSHAGCRLGSKAHSCSQLPRHAPPAGGLRCSSPGLSHAARSMQAYALLRARSLLGTRPTCWTRAHAILAAAATPSPCEAARPTRCAPRRRGHRDGPGVAAGAGARHRGLLAGAQPARPAPAGRALPYPILTLRFTCASVPVQAAAMSVPPERPGPVHAGETPQMPQHC